MKIAIVGAGITGSLLANIIDSETWDVSIFEKSRGCGGRASTKQTDFGQCDLGATIVPAQKLEFINFMQQQCNQNLASKWPENVFVIDQLKGNKQALAPFISDREYYIFNKKMNAACRHWVRNTDLHTNSLISQMRYLDDKGWQLKVNDVWQTEWFDKLVLTVPWPQSQKIIEESELPIEFPQYSQTWTSCWSIALKIEQLLDPKVDLVYLKQHPIQSLIRDSGKPQRPQNADEKSEIWVAQLANKLSDELGERGREEAISLATKTLCELFDLPDKSVSNTYAHYWRYARPRTGEKSLGILSMHELGIYVGGDWSFGASIESAYEAAFALSQLIKTSE